jgi:hypothetical protein
MESLAGLRERRAFECRLTAGRALESLDEAEGFLRERGLLTRTTDSDLPSLYEACHEEAYQPGGRGFATWPATKWPWFGELAGRGYPCVAVHRGKNLLVSGETAALLDPICRAETDRMRAEDPAWRRLLDHLAMAGPSLIDDLRLELGLKRQELKALRSPLERCGAVVARSVAMTSASGAADSEAHAHSTELSRWDQAYAGVQASGPGNPPPPAVPAPPPVPAPPAGPAPPAVPAPTVSAAPAGPAPTLSAPPLSWPVPAAPADPVTALGDLLAEAVRAAVIAPEAELRRWFSWSWYWTGTLVDDLVRSGRLRRVDGHLTAG